MHNHCDETILIALNSDEIETIIDALEHEWETWHIRKDGILLKQFKVLKERLNQNTNNLNDDFV